MELLVLHHINVELHSWLEALLLHPISTISVETNGVIADSTQVLNDFRANEVSLARVGEQADRLDVLSCEASFGDECTHVTLMQMKLIINY